MSENEKNTDSKQTSSIPLKKETVRVTLKAADAPPARPPGAPSANSDEAPVRLAPPVTKPIVPSARPVAPTVPGQAPAPAASSVPPIATKQAEAPASASAPNAGTSTPTAPAANKPPQPTAPKPPTPPAAGATRAPAPTIPLKTAGAKAPGTGAPTIKLGGATTKPSTGAPTIALKTASKASLPGMGDATKPTATLPKATVALSPPTKPLTAGGVAAKPSKPDLATAETGPDETGAETFTNILAGVGLAAAIIVLSLQLNLASVWIDAEDNESEGGFSQLLD